MKEAKERLYIDPLDERVRLGVGSDEVRDCFFIFRRLHTHVFIIRTHFLSPKNYRV